MNDKTIIEFGFRILWRIKKIQEGVFPPQPYRFQWLNTLLDLHNSSDDIRPHSIIVKYTVSWNL